MARANARSWLACAVAVIVLALGPHAAGAQMYPDKPIRLVVPFPAGGGGDLAARLLSRFMSADLGKPIVVENRAGANGLIGVEAVAKSPADGYTLLFSSGGALAIQPHFSKLPYDPLRDLAPISLAVINDGVILVHPSFPATNLQEFIAVVKKSPGKYAFGTSGTGGTTHLAGELLKSRLGLDLVHVPYKGDAPALNDLVGGQIPIMVTVFASATPYIKSGRARAIAAMGTSRFTTYPDLPTVAESGFPGFSGGAWLGLLAPAGTPAAIIDKLNASLRRAEADPALRQQLIDLGSRPAADSPAGFAKFIRDEYEQWGNVIRAANIQLDK